MTLPLAAWVIGLPARTPSTDFAAEAARLTEKTIAHFYDSKAKIWRPTVESSESVGVQGYTFWPSLLAWQAIIEAAKVDPKRWKPRIAPFYDALEQYFDVSGHAYCAWRYFEGNDDKFYDDNAWAAIACMEAFETTGDPRYKARAIEVFEGFVRGGWGSPGGVAWGVKAGLEDRKDRTVSATAAGALAALLIAKTHDGHANRAWAKRALDWIRDTLSAPNGLIYDGLRSPSYARMDTIWTYNTGVTIRAALEYARQTGDKPSGAWAIRMGNACLDRTQAPMYDGAVRDLSKRYWYDAVYFVQYLVDGMRELSRTTGDRRYRAEARRQAEYIESCLRDRDGLYWRNMRLWTIDPARHAAFQKLTGQDGPPLTADSSERSAEPSALVKPVEERPVVKTLLANAGAARMYWLLAH